MLHALNAHSASVTTLKNYLRESLELRVTNIPKPPSSKDTNDVRVAILFSGGLDCTVLARMTHDLVPSGQPIDLINVAFENPRVVEAAKRTLKLKRTQMGLDFNGETGPQDHNHQLPEHDAGLLVYEFCPDRETGRKSFHELQIVCPERVWRFVAVGLLLIPLVFVAHMLTGQYSLHRNCGT
jgi:asparagine synthetase B (glutamine-hydrolysing)